MKSLIKKLLVAILTYEAKMTLARTRPIIIAVTGSVGKTTTKDAIYAVLKKHVHVRKSEKSYNSEIGVPLSILGIENPGTNIFLWIKYLVEGFFMMLHPQNYPKVLVLEMGVDRPGDMDALTAYVRPDIVVLTRFPDIPVHVEYFNSPEEVGFEKMKLAKALGAEGVIVYNNDDERIVRQIEGMVQRSVGFSRYSLSAFTGASDTIIHENGVPIGFDFVVNTADNSSIVRVHGSLGVQHVYSYTAAIAVASLFDISLTDAADALRENVTPPGRMRLLPANKGAYIIDDTYNSSPAACEQAVMTLGGIKQAKRRIAVLGDMLELGSYSIDEHARIGAVVAKNVDILVTVGVRARGFAHGALRAGMDEEAIFQYDSLDQAGRDIEKEMREGDYILVKASQGIRAERIVEELMANSEKASELLVRQDSFWKKR